MGLITCQDCGASISGRVSDCPKCGGPIKKLETTKIQESEKTTSGKFNALGLMGLGLFFACIFIGVVALMNWPETGDDEELRSAVTEEFLDPSSAEFRNIRWLSEGAACGEVNGANSFGGKTGFQKFYAVRTSATGHYEIFLSESTETEASYIGEKCNL